MLDRILNNLKTSMSGVAAAIITLVAVFGYDANPEIVSACLTIVVLVLGLFAKD